MANKNTNMILAVAVIAVCAIAIIGVGYAYTATTENTGNTSGVKYMTLTQGADKVEDYAGAFDEYVAYDTKTKVVKVGDESSVVTTYKVAADPAAAAVPVKDGKIAVKLGSVVVNVAKTNTTDGFVFSVTNGDTMLDGGQFYIGMKVGDSAEVIREYTSKSENYYQTITEDNHAAATVKDSATPISEGAASAVITVNMYIALDDGETNTKPVYKPLDGVTFTFKADAPASTS